MCLMQGVDNTTSWVLYVISHTSPSSSATPKFKNDSWNVSYAGCWHNKLGAVHALYKTQNKELSWDQGVDTQG